MSNLPSIDASTLFMMQMSNIRRQDLASFTMTRLREDQNESKEEDHILEDPNLSGVMVCSRLYPTRRKFCGLVWIDGYLPAEPNSKSGCLILASSPFCAGARSGASGLQLSEHMSHDSNKFLSAEGEPFNLNQSPRAPTQLAGLTKADLQRA